LRLVAVGATRSGPTPKTTPFNGKTARSNSVRSPRPVSVPSGNVGLVATGSVKRISCGMPNASEGISPRRRNWFADRPPVRFRSGRK